VVAHESDLAIGAVAATRTSRLIVFSNIEIVVYGYRALADCAFANAKAHPGRGSARPHEVKAMRPHAEIMSSLPR
jgi:hypothetical protein